MSGPTKADCAAFAAVAAALALRIVSAQTAPLAFIVIAIYALAGRAQSMHALWLCWLLTMMSSGVAPESTAASAGRYLVHAAAAISVGARSNFLRNGFRIPRPVLATGLLGSFLILHSACFSQVPEVSALKAVSWTLVTTTLVAGWAGLNSSDRSRVEAQMFGGLIAVLVASLPLLFTDIGYLRNGTGFQGILGHPQALGPAMALLGAWLAGTLLANRQPSWLRIATFGLSVAIVVLSEARTAGLALVLGLCGAMVGTVIQARLSFRSIAPGLSSGRLHLLAVLAVGALVSAGQHIASGVTDYLQKRGGQSSVMASYEVSRGSLVYSMLDNFQSSPLLGIGFGIASDPSTMIVERDPLLQLPIGATVEKGVLPVATLEEVGLVGAVFIALWLLMLIRRALRGGLAPASVFLTALFSNLGEATLFSAGGMGLLVLLVLTWAGTAQDGGRCER